MICCRFGKRSLRVACLRRYTRSGPEAFRCRTAYPPVSQRQFHVAKPAHRADYHPLQGMRQSPCGRTVLPPRYPDLHILPLFLRTDGIYRVHRRGPGRIHGLRTLRQGMKKPLKSGFVPTVFTVSAAVRCPGTRFRPTAPYGGWALPDSSWPCPEKTRRALPWCRQGRKS